MSEKTIYYNLEDAGYLQKGTKYICYLELYDNVPASLLNPSQGKRIIK